MASSDPVVYTWPAGGCMGRISLCMIVKNEERFLPGCLASVRDLVHEIVISDTGSDDRTVEIAREAGAVVRHFPWTGDFSAARNDALAGASGDWVLWLDADERLATGGAKKIRKAIQKGGFDYGMLPLHNAWNLDVPEEEVIQASLRSNGAVLLPRLVRRTPDLAWDGTIHENVGEWVVRGKRKSKVIEAHLVHYGRALRTERQKASRNTELLRRRIAEEPDFLPTYHYLAGELNLAGDDRGAAEVVEAGWNAFERLLRVGAVRYAIIPLATARMEILTKEGKVEDVIATGEVARGYGAIHPNLDFCEARAIVMQASIARQPSAERLERAVRLAKACLAARGQYFSEHVMPEICGRASNRLLGDAYLMLGRPGEALSCFDAVLEEHPDDEAARVGRVEALLESGEASAALVAVQHILPGGRADAWVLAGAAAAALGSLQDARLFAQQALKVRSQGLHLPRRLYRVETLLA